MINSEFEVPLEYIEYDKLINLYRNYFGKNNVFVFLYEDFLENNTEFLNNYIKLFNLDINIETINFNRKNEMLKKILLNVMRFSNRFTKYEVRNKNYYFNIPYLFEIFNKNYSFFNKIIVGGNKPNYSDLIDEETVLFLKTYFNKSNKLLINNYNLNIERYNYPML